MGQVTIYLDDALEAKMVADAKACRLSKSKWIATVIREKLTSEWPHEVREAAGSWGDFPSLTEIRGETHADNPRESL